MANLWNDYQQANAGKGWSRAEMREKYQAWKEQGCPSLVDDAVEPTSPSKEQGASNLWNDYQQANAGKGWSKAEMSANYQAWKKRGCPSLVDDEESEAAQQQDTDKEERYKDLSLKGGKEQDVSNLWNDYQQANAGKGWSKAEMSANYQAWKKRGCPPLVDDEVLTTPQGKQIYKEERYKDSALNQGKEQDASPAKSGASTNVYPEYPESTGSFNGTAKILEYSPDHSPAKAADVSNKHADVKGVPDITHANGQKSSKGEEGHQGKKGKSSCWNCFCTGSKYEE